MGEGYRRKVYKLKWPEGHELHDLHVTTKGLSIKQALRAGRLARGLGSGTGEAQEQAIDELNATFARKLISWDLLEDDGTPVPPTLEGVEDQDMGLMLTVITDWIDAVSSVDSPLPPASANGQSPAPEASIPAEALSPNLQF